MIARLEVEAPGRVLQVFTGEMIALLGANGAGKTTLLRAIMGFEATPAQVRLDGVEVGHMPAFRRSRLGIGYCPEGRHVFPRMTVRENLEVAARADVASRLAEICDLFPALAGRLNSAAGQLSGGEQQMLAIGRALMTNPKLLLLDEPSLGLSPQLADLVLGRLRDIAARGTAVLLAEQNTAMALDVTDRAYVLQLGRVVHEGRAADLRTDPALGQAFLGG